ncbi:1-phosphofructokinase [Thorsellia anophelis]|uniref:Phosphofructokinase n=1 Tax=Thorsellia anophelis DSM 18579 TaxID=1123402 RepID=A0A1H9ZB77_9GAMM|nr:1-phosphofructokinase [Thorsellia anophelis]SES78320.1 1-phosphofructokinase [Thorsellia anophelis DSM 18579]
MIEINSAFEKTNRVVVISLNPAIDLTGMLDSINLGHVNAINNSEQHPAGKGINVASVLVSLGAAVTLTGFLGQDNANDFTNLFNSIGIVDDCIKVPGSTRTNCKLVDSHNQVTEFNFQGFIVTETLIEKLEKRVLALTNNHDYFVISGSVPPGFKEMYLFDWITKLRKMNKRVLFDSSKDALKQGMQALPWLVKPNEHELSSYSGKLLIHEQDYLIAAKNLLAQGIEQVVISKGEKGVLWVNQEGILISIPPPMNIVSTVGAGDTLVAGLCWSFMQQFSRTETLSFSTALAALSVTQVGVCLPSLEEIYVTQKSVAIKKFDRAG